MTTVVTPDDVLDVLGDALDDATADAQARDVLWRVACAWQLLQQVVHANGHRLEVRDMHAQPPRRDTH